MEISERIKRLGNYFEEMQITDADGQKVIYIVVNFPNRWVIDEEFAKSKGVTIAEDQMPGRYYFCTDLETGADVVFDVIDDNIDKMKEAIERAQLLATKTKELKALFEDEKTKIEKLRTIKFCFDDDTPEEIIVPKQTKGDKKK
jgi:hypothetical protein